MRLRDPVEIVYLALMHRWQTTAPGDRKHGTLDGEPEVDSPVARLAYMLNKLAVGQTERVFRTLERLTVRRGVHTSLACKKALGTPILYVTAGSWRGVLASNRSVRS